MDKEKIKDLMLHHLISVGWTPGRDDIVFDNLRPMWVKLEASGLLEEVIQAGFTFGHFEACARRQHLKSSFEVTFV